MGAGRVHHAQAASLEGIGPVHVVRDLLADGTSPDLGAGQVLAVFRFKVGMVPTLAACAVAGVALHLAGLV
jgi:hypothetical protein